MVTLLVSVVGAKPETDVLVLAHVKGKLTYFSGENAEKMVIHFFYHRKLLPATPFKLP